MIRLNSGDRGSAPFGTKLLSATNRQEMESLAVRTNPFTLFETFTDFDQSTLGLPYAARTATTAGTPTFAQVTNGLNGLYAGTLAANNEAETAGFDFADVLMINKPDAGAVNVNSVTTPVFQAYIKLPALAANQTMVIGLGTAFNATLTSIAEYAWFRFNANNNVLIESKDGTTTNTAVTPLEGTTTVDSTKFHLYTIDWTDITAVRFFLDNNPLGTLSMAALTTSMKFQPLAYLQKSSGTGVPAFQIDWAHTISWRF